MDFLKASSSWVLKISKDTEYTISDQPSLLQSCPHREYFPFIYFFIINVFIYLFLICFSSILCLQSLILLPHTAVKSLSLPSIVLHGS